jgi:hypothetical protein
MALSRLPLDVQHEIACFVTWRAHARLARVCRGTRELRGTLHRRRVKPLPPSAFFRVVSPWFRQQSRCDVLVVLFFWWIFQESGDRGI